MCSSPGIMSNRMVNPAKGWSRIDTKRNFPRSDPRACPKCRLDREGRYKAGKGEPLKHIAAFGNAGESIEGKGSLFKGVKVAISEKERV